MTGNTKRKTLILLGLVILTTMVLAVNLPQLELQPGMPLPRLERGQVVAAPAENAPSVSMAATTFILVLIALVLTGATLYSVYQLLRGADWKLIGYFLRYLLIISLGVGCLVFLLMLFPTSVSEAPPMEIAIPTLEPAVTSPVESAPPLLLWLVGVGLLGISLWAVWWIFAPARPIHPLDLVGLEAEKARQALITGMDLKDVILHCYLQMSLAMKQEQGLEREDFMTTGEFEIVLQAAGIPHEPIHQLTRLFDAVRYGNWQPNAVDEQQAIQCLDAIRVHSRDASGRN